MYLVLNHYGKKLGISYSTPQLYKVGYRLYLDSSLKIYVFLGDGEIDYYADGKIYQAGDSEFEYYADGRIFKVGDQEFEYYYTIDDEGKLYKIGNSEFSYYYDGNLYQINSTTIEYYSNGSLYSIGNYYF